MINKIELIFKNIEKDISKNLEIAIDKSTSILLDDVKEKSPTDTKKYIRWHKVEKSKKTGDIIKGSVYNDMEYAKEVEYWFRSSAVNWHKWPPRNSSTRFYTWVGARVYARSYDENKDKIKDLITNSVNNAIK